MQKAVIFKILGSIANGKNEEIQEIIAHGFIPEISQNLQHSSVKIRHFSLWTLSNILATDEKTCWKTLEGTDLLDKILSIIALDVELVRVLLKNYFCL